MATKWCPCMCVRVRNDGQYKKATHCKSLVKFDDIDISQRQARLGQNARNCISWPAVNVT